MKHSKSSKVEASLSIVIGLIPVIFPMTWYFRLALLLLAAGLIIDIVIRSTHTAHLSKNSKNVMCGIVLIVLGVLSWNTLRQDYYGAMAPEVALKFIYPSQPALVIENLSDKTVKTIKWTVILWNTSRLDGASAAINPLPIPVQTFDFIRPKSSGGPNNIFNTVASSIRPGDRLLGMASVVCPECAKGRVYIVSIEWGKGGWYYEMTDIEDESIRVPATFTKEYLEKYFLHLESIAVPSKRIGI